MSHAQFYSSDGCGELASFLGSTLPVSINFLFHDRMVDLAGDFLSHLHMKFRWARMSGFVFINQETHWAFPAKCSFS